MIWYDNTMVDNDETPEGVEVERIYCFDRHRFSEADWEALARAYEHLPGGLRHGVFDQDQGTYIEDSSGKGLPFWFGVGEESAPFLSASVEPPGLQVYGILSRRDWEVWDQHFRALAKDLPMRDIG